MYLDAASGTKEEFHWDWKAEQMEPYSSKEYNMESSKKDGTGFSYGQQKENLGFARVTGE